MSFLSTGPFNHNRFAQLEEQRLREKMYFMEKKKEKKLDPVGKEDADIDNDGDVDESDSYLKNRRDAVGKAMGKGKDKKEMKESSCSPGCDCDDCNKKSKKKKIEEWVVALVEEGYDLSEYDMDDMEAMYDAAITRDDVTENIELNLKPKKSKVSYSGGSKGDVVNMEKEVSKPIQNKLEFKRVKSKLKNSKSYRAKYNKEDVTRDDVIDYLMESGFCNNPVSSEVLIDNMSDAWLEQILEDLAQRTKNIIDADRSGAHGPGHQIQKMMGAAAHSVNKAKHSARYMKGRV